MNEAPQVIHEATDLAWAAGFIDGEGCIALYPRRQILKGKTYHHFVLRLHVSNTDLLALERLQTLFGGSINKANHKDRPHYKPCWTWYCNTSRCEQALESLMPYLFSKKSQAVLGIASRRYIQRNGRPRAPESLQAQAQIYSQLRQLKRVA